MRRLSYNEGILTEYGLIQQGYSVDRAVDWWVSGVVLYEMLICVMVCYPLIVRMLVIIVAKGPKGSSNTIYVPASSHSRETDHSTQAR